MLAEIKGLKSRKDIQELLHQIKRFSMNKFDYFNTETIRELVKDSVISENTARIIIEASEKINSLALDKLAATIYQQQAASSKIGVTSKEQQFLKSQMSKFNGGINSHTLKGAVALNKTLNVLPGMKINRVLIGVSLDHDENGYNSFGIISFYINNHLIPKAFQLNCGNEDGAYANSQEELANSMLDEVDYLLFDPDNNMDREDMIKNVSCGEMIANKLIYQLRTDGTLEKAFHKILD